MWMRVASMSASSSRASIVSMASTGPEATHWVGLFTAAIERSAVMYRRASSGERGTLNIAPGGSSSKSAPLRVTTPSASSRVITPDRQAAVYSPMLCPIIAEGSIPHERRSVDIAYSTVNRHGSAWSGRSMSGAAEPSSGWMSARRSSPSSGRAISAHASTAARNTGSSL